MPDQSKDPFEGLIDLRDLAKKPWGHRSAYYRNLIRKGEFQGFKHGRHVFVRLDDIKPKPMPMPKRVNVNGKRKLPAARSRATPAPMRASKREAVTKPASKKKGKGQI